MDIQRRLSKFTINARWLYVMADVVISVPLCFLCNYLGKVARSVLITNVAGFYEDNEIVEAKNVLFNVVTTMKRIRAR